MAHDQEVKGSNPGTVYWVDVSNLLAITLKKNWKIKVAKWGTPKKYFRKTIFCAYNNMTCHFIPDIQPI
jgi:hypothetical protein